MATARWKDLCMDASRPAEVAKFWADALDLEAAVKDNGDWVLRGVRSERTVWIDRVLEPKTVKNRVHLDLVRRSTGPLVALGGHELREVMDGGETWMVVDDPDGAELCVFDSAQGEPSALVVDCVDAVAQAGWWAGVLHAETVPAPDGTPRWLAGVSGLPFEVWKFVPVPEPKTVKNRVHWDVVCPDVDALVARGAAVARAPDDEISWHVLADPEGNEFCAFAPEGDAE
jgi:Glyoxalase-like domain